MAKTEAAGAWNILTISLHQAPVSAGAFGQEMSSDTFHMQVGGLALVAHLPPTSSCSSLAYSISSKRLSLLPVPIRWVTSRVPFFSANTQSSQESPSEAAGKPLWPTSAGGSQDCHPSSPIFWGFPLTCLLTTLLLWHCELYQDNLLVFWGP